MSGHLIATAAAGRTKERWISTYNWPASPFPSHPRRAAESMDDDDTRRTKTASLSPTDTITLFAEQWDQNPLFAVAEITETPFVAATNDDDDDGLHSGL